MRLQRVSNSMVRANLNVMGRPAKQLLTNYARKHNISMEEATRKALGLIRNIEKISSKEIDADSAGFTPFLTFVGIKNPSKAIFNRAVSSAEHGKIPAPMRVQRFSSKDPRAYIRLGETRERMRYKKFKTIQEIEKYMKTQEKGLYKKPVSKLEIMKGMVSGISADSYKYCTAYSTKHLREVIDALEKKKISPDLLGTVTHEMREILDPHIRAETTIHIGLDEKDKRIAQSVHRKLQKEYR